MSSADTEGMDDAPKAAEIEGLTGENDGFSPEFTRNNYSWRDAYDPMTGTLYI